MLTAKYLGDFLNANQIFFKCFIHKVMYFLFVVF